MRVADIPKIEKLSTPEKIILAENIWDNIAVDESSLLIHHSHREEWDKDSGVTNLTLANFYLLKNFKEGSN